MSLTSSPTSIIQIHTISDCFPHLLCNVYHHTSSDLFNPCLLCSVYYRTSSDLLHLLLYVSIPSQPCLSLQCLPPHILPLHSIISLTSSSSSLLIMCPYHLSLASLPFCNVYHHTSSDLFIPWYFWPAFLHLLFYVSIPSQPCFSLQCLPPHVFLPLHSIISLTSSSSSPHITCPYHLNLASLTFSAISTTHIFWSLHSMISLTSSSSPCLNLLLSPYFLSAIFTTPHLLISSFLILIS